MDQLSPALAAKRDQLLDLITSFETCAVAFSGGVDSCVVAQAAHLALGDKAVAITAVSPSVAASELETAREIAKLIGMTHREIATDEFASEAYLQNAPDRCFHCKTELYSKLESLAPQLGLKVLLNGANLDDQGDYRPGMQAAREHQVRSPLLECQLSKAEVRQLAAHWNLPVWNKPASPCLSSRIAYGEAVTPERVSMIEQAEQYLHRLNLPEVRVRYHRGDMARVEVPVTDLARLAEPELAAQLVSHFKSLGFRFVTLDLEGFRSGSLNQMLPVESLRMVARHGNG